MIIVSEISKESCMRDRKEYVKEKQMGKKRQDQEEVGAM